MSLHLRSFSPGARDWEPLLALAEAADEVGVDRLAVSDHVVFGEDLDAYADPGQGGTVGGRQPTGPDGHWLEPVVLLSVVAGRTRDIRLGTAILLAALRRPAVLAKEVATLDVLSGGRLDLGVGIGWQRAEYEACGLPFSRRGLLLDHTLEVCHRLWTDEAAAIDDELLQFAAIHAMPKPVQPGGVPIWVSGRINDRTVARIARHGAGWIPWGEHVSDPGPGVSVLRDALATAGRDPEDLQVQGSVPLVVADGRVDLDRTLAPVPGLVAAGVTDVRLLHAWGVDPDAEVPLLEQVVPAFRRLVGRDPG